MVQNTIDQNRYLEINDKLWGIGRNWLCALKQYAFNLFSFLFYNFEFNLRSLIFYLLTHVSFSLYKEGKKKKKKELILEKG